MKVLYFAEIKELVNRSEDVFHFDYAVPVADLTTLLYQTYPVIQGKNFKLQSMKSLHARKISFSHTTWLH